MIRFKATIWIYIGSKITDIFGIYIDAKNLKDATKKAKKYFSDIKYDKLNVAEAED
jgi:hypothetical protein